MNSKTLVQGIDSKVRIHGNKMRKRPGTLRSRDDQEKEGQEGWSRRYSKVAKIAWSRMYSKVAKIAEAQDLVVITLPDNGHLGADLDLDLPECNSWRKCLIAQ